MGKVERVDGAVIDSGLSFALTITGKVPVGMDASAVQAWVVSCVSVTLQVTPFMKAASVTVVKEKPEVLAQRLAGALGSSIVQ